MTLTNFWSSVLLFCVQLRKLQIWPVEKRYGRQMKGQDFIKRSTGHRKMYLLKIITKTKILFLQLKAIYSHYKERFNNEDFICDSIWQPCITERSALVSSPKSPSQNFLGAVFIFKGILRLPNCWIELGLSFRLEWSGRHLCTHFFVYTSVPFAPFGLSCTLMWHVVYLFHSFCAASSSFPARAIERVRATD